MRLWPVLIAGAVYGIVASLATRLLASRPAVARGVTLASGIIMIGLGAGLLIEQQIPNGKVIVGSHARQTSGRQAATAAMGNPATRSCSSS